MKKNKKIIWILLVTTLIFCILIGFDFFPFLRGPAPYPPEWQWSYQFINTIDKLYAPFISIVLIVAFFYYKEINNIFSKRQTIFFIMLILLFFFFQISLLFFSRSGIAVLIHRIINPELNGYFTASLSIQHIGDFLKTYNQEMLNFVYHAKAHPPGAILLFYLIKLSITPFSFLIEFINQLTPTHLDVRQEWERLLPIEKTTAVVSAFFIPFLSTLSVIPLYFSAKILYGTKVALRSIFLFLLIPSLLFFIPINDTFLHLFSIASFFFFIYGLKTDNKLSLLVSGFILFVGVFFNLSLLPVLVLFFIFALLFLKKRKASLQIYLSNGSAFSLGFFSPAIILSIFFHFNFIQVIQTIMRHVPDVHTRSYSLWTYYNLQDFFIFCGIPLSLIFFFIIKKTLSFVRKPQWNKIDILFIALLFMILILNFSGSVRGETGRLWSPYVPFMVLCVTAFVTEKLKFSTKLFCGLLLLQALQILVMQEFWVMLW